eukprot:2342171-Amphidinium_carterae.1
MAPSTCNCYRCKTHSTHMELFICGSARTNSVLSCGLSISGSANDSWNCYNCDGNPYNFNSKKILQLQCPPN